MIVAIHQPRLMTALIPHHIKSNNGIPAYTHLRADRGEVVMFGKWNGLYKSSDSGAAEAALYARAQGHEHN